MVAGRAPVAPASIDSGTTGSFLLDANRGIHGAEGSCEYGVADGVSLVGD